VNNHIELKNVCRAYINGAQSVTVLKDINLTIASGEIVAIVGASGSGKSTLMNILGCLDVPNSGDYFIAGQSVADLSPDELARIRREHIGFIFQRYHLMPDITALSNVEIPAIYANTKRSVRRLRAAQLLARLGLEGREHHNPGALSGGEQQRVSIARALINGGELILADEPTGALDSCSGEEVLQILTELNRQGHTVVIVTHDRKVAEYAHRVIELRDGRIIADNCCRAIEPSAGLSGLPEKLSDNEQEDWRSLWDRTRESLITASKALSAHRLRTVLTMAGIVFGIAAVVTVMALGQGAKQRTLDDIKKLGTNMVSIYSGGDYFDSSGKSRRPLTLSDLDVLASQSFVDSASPEILILQPVRFRAKSANAAIEGVGRDYFRVEGIALIEGSNFSDYDDALQEVIIDENTRNAIFHDDEGSLGQTILIGSVPAKVVGVARNNHNYSPNRLSLWMPYTTVMYRLLGQQNVNSIIIRLKDDTSSEAAANAITQLLTQRHGDKDFMLFNRDQIRRSIERTGKTLSLLILVIASISLFIGSLGVMNIMLISVSERTHEIGIRMAVGARRSDIMQQFMTEAILVCLAGGVLGIALSLAIAPLFSSMAGSTLTPIYSWKAAFLAFVCSTLIGTVFGYLPARKAARMDPVVSLASE
jgi:macrolide transport system ATP-binding/permease protein